jgi:hypothetical protein
MKKAFLLIIIFLCIAVPKASAQRYLPGQRGIQVNAGAAVKNGFYTGVALSQYTKSADRWVFGVEYLEKRHPYERLNIPQSQFTVEGGYYLKFLSDWKKTFLLSLGTSAIAGYETINWDNKILYNGATINNADAFLYGGALTLETEIFITDRLVLLANIRERLLMGSSVGRLNTQLGMGIKCYI